MATKDQDTWLAAGLCLAAGGAVEEAEMVNAVRWIEACVSTVGAVPPVGIVVDLGRVLLRAPFDPRHLPATANAAARATMASYAEHFIGRIRGNRHTQAACDAALRLPPDKRADAVAVFTEQVLDRLGYRAPPASAARIRRALRRPMAELFEEGEAAIAEGRADDVIETYDTITRAARRTGALVSDAEVFVLENLASLSTASQRLALAQIADAAELIERGLPRRIKSAAPATGRTPTKIEDESTYPIGGYASIGSAGSIENVVSSELVYMDDDQAIDLFDVRYAADELLKYTRDESVFVRERRALVLHLDLSVLRARVKDRASPWQRLVLAMGLVVAFVRRVAAWLEEADLRIVVASHPKLRAEIALVELLLAEYVERGVLELEVVETFDDANAIAHRLTKMYGTTAVHLSWSEAAIEDDVPWHQVLFDRERAPRDWVRDTEAALAASV